MCQLKKHRLADYIKKSFCYVSPTPPIALIWDIYKPRFSVHQKQTWHEKYQEKILFTIASNKQMKQANH